MASGKAKHGVVQEKECYVAELEQHSPGCIFVASYWAAKPCSDTLAQDGQPAGATPVNLAAVTGISEMNATLSLSVGNL